ncbi:MAG: hypothetical protein QOG57_6345 [Pseudonocardiales bacterium]|nr:hypothetical protein [Pseudonocardiales bacterium]
MTGAESGGVEPAAVAAEMVLAVQDSTEDRFHLAADFYLADSGDRSRYGRAELSFLRWEIARGC